MPDPISKHLTRHLAERRRSGQGGFSLVELMVVLLIIAVLLGVAIPTYLGARDRAENRAAQEGSRTGMQTLESIYTGALTFSSIPSAGSGASPSALQAAEPALQWSSMYSFGPNNVAAGNLGSNAAIEVVKSASDHCYWEMVVETPTAQIIGSSFFNSATVTGPGYWFGYQSPGGSQGQCVLGLNSPYVWYRSSMKGWE